MEKDLKYIDLFEIYKDFLTAKQQYIFKNYYYNDLSLREIAQNLNITYQAVNDSLKISKNTLESYENTLENLKRKEKVNSLIIDIEKNLNKENLNKENLNNEFLQDIKNKLENIF